VHSSFEDGSEMVEEYGNQNCTTNIPQTPLKYTKTHLNNAVDVSTDELMVRKFREKGALGPLKDWVITIITLIRA
jgi:hypothetical protein